MANVAQHGAFDVFKAPWPTLSLLILMESPVTQAEHASHPAGIRTEGRVLPLPPQLEHARPGTPAQGSNCQAEFLLPRTRSAWDRWCLVFRTAGRECCGAPQPRVDWAERRVRRSLDKVLGPLGSCSLIAVNSFSIPETLYISKRITVTLYN